MKAGNINHAFLDRGLDGSQNDFFYHFALSSEDPFLEQMRGIQAIITAGSGERIRNFAQHWITLNGSAEILDFQKDDRFLVMVIGCMSELAQRFWSISGSTFPRIHRRKGHRFWQ